MSTGSPKVCMDTKYFLSHVTTANYSGQQVPSFHFHFVFPFTIFTSHFPFCTPLYIFCSFFHFALPFRASILGFPSLAWPAARFSPPHPTRPPGSEKCWRGRLAAQSGQQYSQQQRQPQGSAHVFFCVCPLSTILWWAVASSDRVQRMVANKLIWKVEVQNGTWEVNLENGNTKWATVINWAALP